ncbi:MAG: hypothetical protein IJI05_03510, partial [Erysipelotrichaceae bacterium]|nr:hypothetical protein [Erysipelotrichaceae bacterium]
LSDITRYAAGRTADGRFVRTGMESITTIINAMLLLDILEEAYIDTDPDVILDSSKHRTDKLQDTRKY